MMDDFRDVAERIREAFAADGEPELGAGVANALSAVFGGRGYHPLAGVDLEGMVAEGKAMIAQMQARRQEKRDRNAASREAAMRVYRETASGPSPTAARPPPRKSSG